MELAAVIVASVALIVAYLAVRQISALHERLDQTAGAVAELRTALNETTGKLNERLSDQRLAARQQSGETVFSPKMTIAEAMLVHPKVSDVLDSFHLGGCSHCAVSDVDTLEGACQTYGIDQKALMAALNGLASGNTGGASAPAKNTNVQVNF